MAFPVEHAVVAGRVESRRRHPGGELLYELPRLEDDVGGAVAPAVFQAVEERPVRQAREAVGRDRRPGHVTQALEAPSIPRWDRDVGVEAHAVDAGAALAFERREGFGVDAIADAERASSGAPSRGNPSRDRGGVERGEKRLLAGQRIGIAGVGLRV